MFQPKTTLQTRSAIKGIRGVTQDETENAGKAYPFAWQLRCPKYHGPVALRPRLATGLPFSSNGYLNKILATVRDLDHSLHNGLGVMPDDVMAAFYAAGILMFLQGHDLTIMPT